MKPSSSTIALFALLLLQSSYCAAQGNLTCSVCGEGKKVGNPDANVVFPGQSGQIPCRVLEQMGTVGLIPAPQCAVLPQLISTICECEPSDVPTTTTVATTAATTEATQPGGKSSKQSLSISSKVGKSAVSATAGKCGTTIAPVYDTTIATSSGFSFSNSDLITLLNRIVYSYASLPVGERAEQVDSLDAESIQDVGFSSAETNELLEDIRSELVDLNANFKDMEN